MPNHFTARSRSRSRGVRRSGAAAAAALLAVTLSACSTGGGPGGGSEGTIVIAVTNALTSLNSNTPQANLDVNGMVELLGGNSGEFGFGTFFVLDQNYELDYQTQMGAVELISEDPLTVRYALEPDLKWSDGEPITADDLLFAWVVKSGWADDHTPDPETGKAASGTHYFTLAGSTDGYDVTTFPEIGDDDLSIELTFTEPYVDWELINPIGKPAHVVAEAAGVSLAEFAAELRGLPEGDPANPAPVNETLRAAADFWNGGYDITEMPSDEKLLVGSGPFIVSDFSPEQSVTLAKNEHYPGAADIAFDELIIRFIGDANAQVSALRNSEVNAITPQPSADTLAALENIDAELFLGDELSYDHLDLNHGSEVFSEPSVREAFLRTVPRQQILEAIITPVNPNAQVLNSQIYVPTNAEYADAAAVNGYDDFVEPDIEAATALLAGATPTVKILYNSANPNRVDSFQAIKASAEQAGFVIEDGGSPDWSTLLSGGEYDASIFGWISAGVGNAALPQIWRTGGGGNYNNYSNPDSDALVDEAMRTLDPEALKQLKIRIDAASNEARYGLPLFQLPGMFAGNGTIAGLDYFGGQAGLVWNAPEWSLVD